MALLMRMVGFEKARNYDGSFYEWAGDPSLPLE
jgi:3-mercaptopyruvate sulfurtransferase SseA